MCTPVFVSLWPVSMIAGSDTEGASIGAASDRSGWKDFNNGHPRQRQTDRERERCKAEMGKERENDSTHE